MVVTEIVLVQERVIPVGVRAMVYGAVDFFKIFILA